MKNCQIKMSTEVYKAIHCAARKKGLTVSAYMRMLAIDDALLQGFDASPPSAQ